MIMSSFRQSRPEEYALSLTGTLSFWLGMAFQVALVEPKPTAIDEQVFLAPGFSLMFYT
jgi:hypothetical protein